MCPKFKLVNNLAKPIILSPKHANLHFKNVRPIARPNGKVHITLAFIHIIVNYYIIFPVGGTPYPDWNEWKVVYEITVNKHRMSQPKHISDGL